MIIKNNITQTLNSDYLVSHIYTIHECVINHLMSMQSCTVIIVKQTHLDDTHWGPNYSARVYFAKKTTSFLCHYCICNDEKNAETENNLSPFSLFFSVHLWPQHSLNTFTSMSANGEMQKVRAGRDWLVL